MRQLTTNRPRVRVTESEALMSRAKEIRHSPYTVTIVNAKKIQVDLEIGSVLTRAELNEQYGGGIQEGMLTPAGGQLMFLFSDPAAS